MPVPHHSVVDRLNGLSNIPVQQTRIPSGIWSRLYGLLTQ